MQQGWEFNRAVEQMTGWLSGSKTPRPGSEADLRGLVTLITGGTRGLGLVLAREFAGQGCKLVLCARDQAELERVQIEFDSEGYEILTVACDVADRSQVQSMVDQASDRFGRIDILVNNAAIIQVAPLQNTTAEDFEQAMNINFWGLYNTTMAVLPQMQERGNGRIVNVTSIGGKVGIPHLLPYTAAKFAATGFSEGLHSELTGTGISVTTIIPGLTRTGSYLNVPFKGQQADELQWFGLGDSLPFLSQDAERAARQIVEATRNRQAERILSLPAITLSLLHGMAPGTTATAYGWVNRLVLPAPAGSSGQIPVRGMELNEQLKTRSSLWSTLTGLGLAAARRFNQYPGPLSVFGQSRKPGEGVK